MKKTNKCCGNIILRSSSLSSLRTVFELVRPRAGAPLFLFNFRLYWLVRYKASKALDFPPQTTIVINTSYNNLAAAVR